MTKKYRPFAERERLKIVTPDNQLLTLVAIGKPDQEKGCNTFTCLDDNGKKIEIEVPGFTFFGSYCF